MVNLKPLVFGTLAATVVVFAACSAPAPTVAETTDPVPAPAPAALESPVSINAEMVALIDHAGHELWDVEQAGPKAKIDWVSVDSHVADGIW